MARQRELTEGFFIEDKILPAIARHASRQELDAAVKAWRVLVLEIRHPNPEAWRGAASRALAIAGREQEALEILMELPAGSWRQALLVQATLESAARDRFREAGAVMQHVSAEEQPELSRLEVLERTFKATRYQSVRPLAHALGFDANDVSGPAAYIIADADLALGNEEFARRRAQSLPAQTGVVQLEAIATSQIQRQRWDAARATLMSVQTRAADIRDADIRTETLARVAKAFIEAHAPRDALPLVKNGPKHLQAERLAAIVEQLAWSDLPAARSVTARIKPADSWQYRTAAIHIAAAEILANPAARKPLDAVEFQRSKGEALQMVAIRLTASGDAAAATDLFNAAADFIAADPDADGRDLAWVALAEAQADLGMFAEAYASAERIRPGGFRLEHIAEVALKQANAGGVTEARHRLAAALQRARGEGASISRTANAALLTVQAGFADEAYEALRGVVGRGANTDRELDEPELSTAKQATAIALARKGALKDAFMLADGMSYGRDEAFVALYEVLAAAPTPEPTVSRLKQ